MHSYTPYAKRQQRPFWHAAAQAIGIDPSSIAWALLDRLLTDPSPLSDALAVGKATLILPTEPYDDDKIRITQECIRDHIAFIDAHAIQFVTLSGLRGTLHSNTLTFRSSLHPSSKLHHALQHASSRAYGFSHLPPLPQPYLTEPEPPVSYPSLSLSAQTLLPLPARIQPKPPLPPRPLTTSSPARPSTPHRLPNPFASLFGVASYPPETADATVPVLLVDRRVARRDLARDINAAIGTEIARALTSRGRVRDRDHGQPDDNDQGYDIPEWVAERVNQFVLDAGMCPFVRELEQGTGLNKRLVGPGRGAALRVEEDHGYTWGVAKWMDKSPEEVAERVQEFYGALEREMRDRRSRAREEAGDRETDAVVTRVVEAVEGVLSRLFYDRLFSQPASDDASHDETLSSRTAALNMLDLTLQHLDIDVGEAGEEVAGVVRACGQTLMQLEACHSPKDKAAVLVAAHKVVVDGLSKLPPLKLIPDKSTAPPPIPPDSTSNPPITTPTPVSGDLLLPFLIFSVVKSNPPHLVSHLLFTQRFRNQVSVESRSTGEETYCLINLMAVAEFVENVDLAALGLAAAPGEEETATSPAGLSPILGIRSPGVNAASASVREGGLRGRVEQQVDAIAGSANKVLTGVMDTSFGMLRSLLPGQQEAAAGVSSGSGAAAPTAAPAINAINAGSAPWNVVRPSFGLLRRESGFSIASIAASLPQAITSRGRPGSGGDHPEDGQQMVTVSTARPVPALDGADAYAFGQEDGRGELAGGEEGEEESEGGEDGQDPSVRSIRSFESMMGERGGGKKLRAPMARKSLSDRLADMSALAIKGSPPVSRPSSLMPVATSRPATPQGGAWRVAPPSTRRFLECSADELKIGEVAELLKEYRRLVEDVRMAGGFLEVDDGVIFRAPV